jgi:hypothetical protein
MPAANVAATGPISLPYYKMAQLLSQCPTFQTAMSVGSEAAALALIDYPEWDTDNSDAPAAPAFNGPAVPGCIVTKFGGVGRDFEIRRGGISQGDLQIQFRMPLVSGHATNVKDQLIAFMNTIGAILDEMWARSVIQVDDAQNIEIEEPVTELEPPQQTDPDEECDINGNAYLIAAYNVPWRL